MAVAHQAVQAAGLGGKNKQGEARLKLSGQLGRQRGQSRHSIILTARAEALSQSAGDDTAERTVQAITTAPARVGRPARPGRATGDGRAREPGGAAGSACAHAAGEQKHEPAAREPSQRRQQDPN